MTNSASQTPAAKLKISEFRSAIDSLNWSRNDLGGATRDELIKMDVKTRLERHIAIVGGMIGRVPARFAADIEEAHKAIGYAEKYIARWQVHVLADAEAKAAAKARQIATQAVPTPAPAAKPHLYLVQKKVGIFHQKQAKWLYKKLVISYNNYMVNDTIHQ